MPSLVMDQMRQIYERSVMHELQHDLSMSEYLISGIGIVLVKQDELA